MALAPAGRAETSMHSHLWRALDGPSPVTYMIIFQKQSLDICLAIEAAEDFVGAVAQRVVVPVMQVELEVVADFESSQRAAGGFGHSGRR